MDKLITFAVPCYNSAAYMDHCVETLLQGGDDIEIILVDDGSTKDDTPAICDEYAAKYPTIVKAIHQENGGHGEGVNQGIRNATGLYYKVVDSDDWLDETALRTVLAKLNTLTARGTAPDLMICNYVYEHVEDNTSHTVRYTNVFPQNRLFNWTHVGHFRPDQNLLMHSVMYRTQVLRDCGMVLPKHTFYVDNIFVYQPLPFVKSMYYMDLDLYRYFIGRADQSVNESVMVKRVDQQLRVTRHMIDCQDLDALKGQKKLRSYMLHYLSMMMAISDIFLLLDGSAAAKQKENELWAYLKAHTSAGVYRSIRYGFGGVTNLKIPKGDKLVLGGYRLAQVESYGIITQVALGFIAFVIGNEFRLSALESMGRQAITVGILQAVITTVLVDIALVALHFARPDVISIASAITLGAIASATAPAATLMVVKQYKASGPLTRLLLMVVAIDDAVGLVLFSASFGIANALEQGRIDPISVLLEPLVEIVLSLGLGALAGLLLNQLEIYFHSRSKRMSLSVAFVLLTVGLSMVSFEVGPIHCSFSLLLVCMMTGTVFCNICPTSDELMDRLDRWVSPVNILFFVLSGAELDLNILANPMVLLIGAVYIASRSLGKISGSYVSCKATRCSEKIQKYLGITLLPQAGVALGMAAEAAELSDGHMVRNVVLFSVLVYELVGPTLAKLSLTAAGEIIPEGRTSARTTNKPEEPVSVD